ncbi:Acyl-CoA-binding domain-containing protein 4 [Nymphaea thermarum]|nr:Acyl-CoA-binding domain-containing protein 4 [Nymphaea thermarum]
MSDCEWVCTSLIAERWKSDEGWFRLWKVNGGFGGGRVCIDRDVWVFKKADTYRKVQLADSTQGLRSPVRHTKRLSHANGENVASANTHTVESNPGEFDTPSLPEVNVTKCTFGSSENWTELPISGEKPTARFSILDFNKLTWSTTKVAPKAFFTPSSLPSKVPPCKGHSLVSWGKKILLIGGKSNPTCERVSVWAFDIETECWSCVEAKGDIPVARSGHSVTRSGSVLILFGGEDVKGRKLNDLHMFDLKSFMWLPLHYTGTGPSARSNHVAALYDDRTLIIFGGAAKSRILNDLYSLDFETMVWSRLKTRGFHPSPRAGCCGVLCGTKWYITGGGSRKKRYAETLVFDVLKVEWSVSATASSSSVTTNKVEVFMIEQSKQSMCLRSAPEKCSLPVDNCSKIVSPSCPIDSIAKQNLKSALEQNGSSRKSLSESSMDQNPVSGNISLRKQFHHEECSLQMKMQKELEEDRNREWNDNSLQSNALAQKTKPVDSMLEMAATKGIMNADHDSPFSFDYENIRDYQKQANLNASLEDDAILLQEIDEKTGSSTGPANVCELYEAKLAATLRKNTSLEGQLSAALASREAMEKYLSTVIKSRQEMEKKLGDSMKEIDLLKEKLASAELAQEEANSLSNIVHSDNVRLEHDVAFLKAVLDDTQKELHSTRGVLAGERARAFQLQVEVFHLKQRLQSLENRAPTPRKPFNV